MREDNPLAYEDVNPFFDPKVTSVSEGPTADDVRAAKGAEALKPTPGSPTTKSQSELPSASGETAATPAWVPFAIGGGALALLLIAGAVVAVVIGARRRRGAGQEQAGAAPATGGDHLMHAPTGAGSGADQGGRR
jgi:hypothetical protein